METGKVILPGARIVIFLTLEGQKKYGEKMIIQAAIVPLLVFTFNYNLSPPPHPHPQNDTCILQISPRKCTHPVDMNVEFFLKK